MDLAIKNMLDDYGVTAATERFLLSDQRMFVNGEFVEADNSETIDVIEPSTASLLTAIPSGTADDIDRAVTSARTALRQGAWSTMKPAERERLLMRLADAIEQRAQTLGEIETIDNGKAIGPCIEMDILGGADLLRYMAGFATKLDGSTRQVSIPGEHMAWTFREPVGVVGAIVPWNWPFNMAMWKMAAALAVGCTMVIKPAQQTSLSLLYFARLCEEVGLPPGVINIVTGRGSTIGDYLANHPGIDKVSFTGSTPVGRTVGEAAGRALSPVTLELGGKSPMIAFDDADPKAVAAATRWSVYFNAGQVCSAGSRLYAHSSVYDNVIEELAKVTSAMKIAPGLDPDCDMGPVISDSALRGILGYIDQGVAEGAELIFGGKRVDRPGYFVEPTLFAAGDNDMSIVQEEIFGPVLVVLKFDSDEEALQMANDNIYGLAGSIWTQDISRALRYSAQLEAGTVWINNHDIVDSNMPCGGFKQSGFGKDMGPEQLNYFTRTKAVWATI
jgi:phenylacetaldehyde dehydrogenase